MDGPSLIHPKAVMQKSRSWWHFPHVWLVVAGPAIVVVASFVTFYLAAKSADPVLSTAPEVQAPSAQNPDISLAPAMQARNHAATGALPANPQPRKP
jgi:uncharacterized protein